MKKSIYLSVLLLIVLIFDSQNLIAQYTQIIKGKAVDKVSGIGLPGAIIQLKAITGNKIVTSDVEGNFKLPDVPIGRQSLIISLTGYNPVIINDLIVSSGKQVVLTIEMDENAVSMDEVEVKTSADSNIVNTMQNAGMKSFSIEETERYARFKARPSSYGSQFCWCSGH